MVVPIIGSMAVKGVFQAGSLLSGLGSMGGKLKEVQQRSKSTSTEMKRMTKGAHQLRNALAAIGIGGFTALLLTTPQLAGALAKIKTEMMLIAWSIGKHLKPALDAVSTILHGIRTGDWSVVVRGVKDLANAAWGLVEAAASILPPDFTNWLGNMKVALEEGRGWDFIKIALYEPFKWVYDHGKAILGTIKDIMGAISGAMFPGLREGSPLDRFISGLQDVDRWIGQTVYDYTGINIPVGQKIETRQVGGMIGRTGMYKMHAGETVTMAGSTPSGGGGSSNITVDFSGANINLAGGIDLDRFSEAISMKIAEKQQSLTY